jgi:hypothetical protein
VISSNGIPAKHTYLPINATPISNQWPVRNRHWLPEADEWRRKMGISTHHVKTSVKGSITSAHKKIVDLFHTINRMKRQPV